MPNGFSHEIGSINFDFNAVPDLQPKAIIGILRKQTLPEENVLRNVIPVVPVADKLFKSIIDDKIDLNLTPEVDMNADDPLVGDSFRFSTDQIHEYRQAAKINIELGQQLLNPEGTAARYAGQSALQRLMRNIRVALDNRREYNRVDAMIHAFEYDPSRVRDLNANNSVEITDAEAKWDFYERDAFGNHKCNPFVQISTYKHRVSFLSGRMPNALIITGDVAAGLEGYDNFAREASEPTIAGARYKIRDLNVFVVQSRKNTGTEDKPILRPMLENMAIITTVNDDEVISERQYDIDRVDQFITADRLFYYVRMWHKSRVSVGRPTNFMFIKNVLANPYSFESVSSLFE